MRWRTFDRRSQDGIVMAAAWFVGVMAICSFSHYKLPHYALPAYPPLMLLAGTAIDRAARHESASRVVVIGLALTAVVIALMGGASLAATLRMPETFVAGATAIGAACLIGGVAGLVLLRRQIGLAAVSLAAGAALAYGAAAILVLPPFTGAAYPYPALGRLVAEKTPPSVALGSIGAHTALVYYADRHVSFVATPTEAAQFLSTSEPRLMVVSRTEFDAIRRGIAVTELASRRRQNPRLSRLLAGWSVNPGTEELLVGNPAAAAIYGR